MKRRGFLKMLGIGAAVPMVADAHAEVVRQLRDNALLASDPNGFVPTIGPMTKIEGPDGSYIYSAANPADWYDAQGNQKRVDVVFSGVSCMTMISAPATIARLSPIEWETDEDILRARELDDWDR